MSDLFIIYKTEREIYLSLSEFLIMRNFRNLVWKKHHLHISYTFVLKTNWNSSILLIFFLQFWGPKIKF